VIGQPTIKIKKHRSWISSQIPAILKKIINSQSIILLSTLTRLLLKRYTHKNKLHPQKINQITMAPSKKVRPSSGVYNVKEDGLEFEHFPGGEETIPKDGEEYLERFQ
jgi:hypothetical protein